MSFFIFLVLFTFSVFAEETSIGSIKNLTGDVTVHRKSDHIKASTGMSLEVGDIVSTSKNSSAGIIFKDSTLFSMGEKSEILINRYVFRPQDSNYAFDINMDKGQALYTSGKMGKLSFESVKINTPKATIGIRGTKFLIKVD
jgi:hypothetical protein